MLSIQQTIKEVINRIPFSNYVIPSTTFSKLVEIKVFEKFDNREFGLETIEFLMSNQEMQIKNATLKVQTSLFGVRWYM